MNAESTQNYEPLRNYLWKYFEYHASQRLTTFNFYIVISTLITTGYFLAYRDILWLAVALGILIMLLSFVFWKLDGRNQIIIRNSIKALEYIEAKDTLKKRRTKPHPTQIFLTDLYQTKKSQEKNPFWPEEAEQKKPFWPWQRNYKYSTCLNVVFLSFGIIGLLATVFALINIIGNL